MKPVLYTLLAMFCFAVANVTIEQKLSKFNNLTIMVCYSDIIFASSYVLRFLTKTGDPSFAFPAGGFLFAVIVTGILFTLGDFFFIGAYTMGGSAIMVAAVSLMFPVFVCAIKLALTKDLPNAWQVGGLLLGAVAVICVAKGTPMPVK